jgi:hypothetical protein
VKEAQGQLAEAFSWLAPVQMNEDQDFSLGGEKNGYDAGELNSSRPPTQCEKAKRGAGAGGC